MRFIRFGVALMVGCAVLAGCSESGGGAADSAAHPTSSAGKGSAVAAAEASASIPSAVATAATATSAVSSPEVTPPPHLPSNRSTSAPEESAVPYETRLLASLPDKNVYLFSKYTADFDGVVLYIGKNSHAYKWIYMTPRGVLPQLAVADYDGDGTEELAVILYIGSGTGVSIEELHIVGMQDFSDHVFTDYGPQLMKAVQLKSDRNSSDLLFKITTGGKTYAAKVNDYNADEFGKPSDTPYFEDIVHFSAEGDKLKAQFGFGVGFEKFVSLQYYGAVTADVEYRAGQFVLTNFGYKENPF